MGLRSKLSPVCLVAALAAGGCAGATPRSAPARSGMVIQGAAASCAGLTRPQQFAAAKVVFDAVMLPGAPAAGSNGVLASPARARVMHYLKGSGPAVATVQTAIETVSGGAERVSEDGIRPRAGEHWRIYASSTTEPYATSICLGSDRLSGRTAHFTGPGISFDYPAAWHARTYPHTMPPAAFTSLIVWLSPQPMHPPCITHHGTHNTTITCTDPISHLGPDSILAYWTTNTDPAGFHSGPRHSHHRRRPPRDLARPDRHHTNTEPGRDRIDHRHRADARQPRQLVPADRAAPRTGHLRGHRASQDDAPHRQLAPLIARAAASGCENHPRQTVQQPPAW